MTAGMTGVMDAGSRQRWNPIMAGDLFDPGERIADLIARVSVARSVLAAHGLDACRGWPMRRTPSGSARPRSGSSSTRAAFRPVFYRAGSYMGIPVVLALVLFVVNLVRTMRAAALPAARPAATLPSRPFAATLPSR